MPIVLHRFLPEAHPDRETTHEAVVLAHRHQRVHNAPIEQAKVARVAWDLDGRDTRDQPIERRGGQQLETGLARAPGTLGVDHLDAGLPTRNQLRDNLGRILQIGVHDDDGVATSVVKSCGDGNLMAEITREIDHTHAGIALV